MAKFNKYRRKTKYRNFQFKLTEQQYTSLKAYCDINKVTSVKAIKQILLSYLEENKMEFINKSAKIKNSKNVDKQNISKKQLNLFDLIEAERSTAKGSS